MRGQAAIFDGIMFLMLVSFSMAMVFTFLNTYGIAQDNVIRSSHTLNYMQSVMKSIYLIDASTLAQADSSAGDCTKGDCQNETGVYGEDMNCSQLASWQVSVGDVVKKDLVDGRLDDKFGTNGAEAPGKTALRCLFREVMKPFRQAGYNYFVEVLDPDNIRPIQSWTTGVTSYSRPRAELAYPAPWVTDTGTGYAGVYSCEDPHINATALLAVSTPFRVQPPGKDDAAYEKDCGGEDTIENYAWPKGSSCPGPTGVINPLGYQLRVCVWPA